MVGHSPPPAPWVHSMTSGIPVRPWPWPWCNELGSEASLDRIRNSCMAKAGVALSIPGSPVTWPRWEKRDNLSSSRSLEKYLPELEPEWNCTIVTGLLKNSIITDLYCGLVGN